MQLNEDNKISFIIHKNLYKNSTINICIYQIKFFFGITIKSNQIYNFLANEATKQVS